MNSNDNNDIYRHTCQIMFLGGLSQLINTKLLKQFLEQCKH